MLKTTFIARASDGLILCETLDTGTDHTNDKLKQKARTFIQSQDGVQAFRIDNKCASTDFDIQYKLNYMTKSGVVYLCLTEVKYPQKLAFVFLNEIADLFQVALQNTYGTNSMTGMDYASRIETVEKSYAFNNFESKIANKRKEFRDGNTAENLQKLNSDLMDVGRVMSESFEMLLDRDRNLNKLADQASNLRESSKGLRKEAKNLKLTMLFRQYATPIIIFLVLFFFIFLKYYFF